MPARYDMILLLYHMYVPAAVIRILMLYILYVHISIDTAHVLLRETYDTCCKHHVMKIFTPRDGRRRGIATPVSSRTK